MNLEPMWKKLAEYQKYADKRGFGEQWKKMTTERTVEAAVDAAYAAWSADAAAATAAAWWAARPADEAAATAEWAIAKITRAIEREGKE